MIQNVLTRGRAAAIVAGALVVLGVSVLLVRPARQPKESTNTPEIGAVGRRVERRLRGLSAPDEGAPRGQTHRQPMAQAGHAARSQSPLLPSRDHSASLGSLHESEPSTVTGSSRSFPEFSDDGPSIEVAVRLKPTPMWSVNDRGRQAGIVQP